MLYENAKSCKLIDVLSIVSSSVSTDFLIPIERFILLFVIALVMDDFI